MTMQTETYYIVQYNDCYGNGNDKTIECLVKDKKKFNEWFKNLNKERREEDELEYQPEEFDLIPVNLIK